MVPKRQLPESQSFSYPREKALSPQMHKPESEGAVRDISKREIEVSAQVRGELPRDRAEEAWKRL